MVNIGCADIHSGSKKLTLGMMWNLILRFEIGAFTEGGDKSKAKADLALWVQNRSLFLSFSTFSFFLSFLFLYISNSFLSKKGVKKQGLQ